MASNTDKRSRDSLLLLALQSLESPAHSLLRHSGGPGTLSSCHIIFSCPLPSYVCFSGGFLSLAMGYRLSLDALAGSPQHPISHIHASTAAVRYTLSHLLHQAASGALSSACAVLQQQPTETLKPTLLSLTALTLPFQTRTTPKAGYPPTTLTSHSHSRCCGKMEKPSDLVRHLGSDGFSFIPSLRKKLGFIYNIYLFMCLLTCLYIIFMHDILCYISYTYVIYAILCIYYVM